MIYFNLLVYSCLVTLYTLLSSFLVLVVTVVVESEFELLINIILTLLFETNYASIAFLRSNGGNVLLYIAVMKEYQLSEFCNIWSIQISFWAKCLCRTSEIFFLKFPTYFVHDLYLFTVKLRFGVSLIAHGMPQLMMKPLVVFAILWQLFQLRHICMFRN